MKKLLLTLVLGVASFFTLSAQQTTTPDSQGYSKAFDVSADWDNSN